MVRLIYVETLGHDASFGYIHAVKLCSDPHLVFKKIGYLASCLFLDENHELILLLINTIQRDLKSDNFLAVTAALDAICKLINPETIPAVLPPVLDLAKHPSENVRKKAAMVLHRFLVRVPAMREDLDRPMRALLCDKDPSVMAAALCGLHEAVRSDPAAYRPLAPSLVSILKQVVDRRLPKTYDYHKVPAPFIQLKLLRMLADLGSGDRLTSEHAYAVVAEAMKRAQTGNTIGFALMGECIRTLCAIYPSQQLLAVAAELLGGMLRPTAPQNLKYAGIGLLADLLRAAPDLARQHQMAVIECLEDQDESLKKRTLDLLCTMCNPENAEVIVDRMIQYLRVAQDQEVKADLAARIYQLAERFAPSTSWFLATVMEVFG